MTYRDSSKLYYTLLTLCGEHKKVQVASARVPASAVTELVEVSQLCNDYLFDDFDLGIPSAHRSSIPNEAHIPLDDYEFSSYV